jgi:peptidoglycan/xylan/chitin deacetylase (PgdA/CDA1 family)
MHPRYVRSFTLIAGLFAASCGAPGSSNDDANHGSVAGSGGVPASGGLGSGGLATTTGGALGSGGFVGVGGDVATGGVGGDGTGGGQTGGSAAGGTSTGGAINAVESGLPIPPTNNVPKPTGAQGGLSVLHWAGFDSAVSYTFDDSQPSHLEHYDELQAAGVPLTFYVNSGRSNQAGYDATFQKAVNDGHEIGNHTAHHCYADLSGCSGASAGSQAAEITTCNDYIKQHFGQDAVWTMASPFGDANWNNAAQSIFFLNRGVGNGTIGPNDGTNPFNLPIHMATTNETTASFNTAIDSAHSAGKWVIFLVHSINPTSATWYNPVHISTITGSIAHVKAMPDVWVDTVVQIGAYWRAEKMFSALAPATSGSDKVYNWTLPAHFPSGKYLRVTVTGGTPKQKGNLLPWNDHGYYEVALDAGSLTLSP